MLVSYKSTQSLLVAQGCLVAAFDMVKCLDSAYLSKKIQAELVKCLSKRKLCSVQTRDGSFG